MKYENTGTWISRVGKTLNKQILKIISWIITQSKMSYITLACVQGSPLNSVYVCHNDLLDSH